ncbi:MAG: Transcriptional regulator, TrmB [Candidatus Roizmanbacteria bacterium GW2011_GWB1_40_7]|uniref:Transcriptional regulator, TrmB n=1 Tax=Candidatus Roizmanbacteria bacterium GW2011_GWB1_40_7 TaxID=1618482 RepID=A0A0G0VL31_9BACT|nr:MAG: Transcriptional regulator, TrmB [Candidatus Roizmanbacteria bacterium GW2011_GWB1_40_7]
MICQQIIDNIMQELLTSIGITENESAIYQSLLKLGPASIRTIATDVEINRGTTYETLKVLVKKGLVTYAPQGKRKYFAARNPYQLIRSAEKKQQLLTSAIERLKSDIVPRLLRTKSNNEIADVRYYEGDEGIEEILHDVLHSVKKKYCVYSSRTVRKYLYRNFPDFTKQRIKRGITVQVIAIGKGGEDTEMAERKWLSAGTTVNSTSYIIIYPPKYALISVTNEDYPYGVVIHEESIARTQKMIFDTVWRLL